MRHITATLAILEKHLARLRDHLEHGARELRRTRCKDRIESIEFPSLLSAHDQAEGRLRRIAGELGLPARTESVRRSFLAALESDSIHLWECQPRGDLAGYKAAAPTTAAYREREIEKLDAAVRALIVLLQRNSDGHDDNRERHL